MTQFWQAGLLYDGKQLVAEAESLRAALREAEAQRDTGFTGLVTNPSSSPCIKCGLPFVAGEPYRWIAMKYGSEHTNCEQRLVAHWRGRAETLAAALREWEKWAAHITDERSGVTKPMLLHKLRERARRALAGEPENPSAEGMTQE